VIDVRERRRGTVYLAILALLVAGFASYQAVANDDWGATVLAVPLIVGMGYQGWKHLYRSGADEEGPR